MKRSTAALGILLLACACHAPARRETPPACSPAQWSAPEAGTSAPDARWWSAFGDPVLEQLVAEAARMNLDLAAARSRLREARALARAAGAGLEPRVDLAAGYARSSPSRNTAQGAFAREDDLFQAGFDASWELDLFGRNAAQLEAARLGTRIAESELAGAALALTAELARTYFELRGTQKELEVVRANAALQRDSLGLTRSRAAAGIATGLDEARAESTLASTEARIPALAAALRGSQQRIAVLLGRLPEELPAGLDSSAPLPEAPRELAAGMPAELVRRRPDLVAAELALARNQELARAAEAELYPRIVLHASLGQQSNEFGSVLDSASRAWSLGPSLVLPLFDRGTLRAQAEAADERSQQALLAWQKAVLGAFAEVEGALTSLARERERLEKLEQSLEASHRALELATELQSRGLVDFFQVLDAQRVQLDADSALAQSRTALAQKSVALCKALGGGWEALEPAH